MQSKTRTQEAWRSPSPSPSKARFLRTDEAIPRVCADSQPRLRESRLDCRPVDEQGTAPQTCGGVLEGPSPHDLQADAVVDAGERARIVGDLYKSYYHRVFCFTRRFARDEEAEEVAHEAFVRLFRVRNLERMSISVAYLLRIAENLLKRRHERAQRYRHILEESGVVAGLHPRDSRRGEVPERSSEAPRAFGDHAVDAARLEAVLGCLTQEEQAAVRLIVCEGLDYQAAARSLGVPVSTINNWKHRGLSKLKQLVQRSRASAFDAGTLAAG